MSDLCSKPQIRQREASTPNLRKLASWHNARNPVPKPPARSLALGLRHRSLKPIFALSRASAENTRTKKASQVVNLMRSIPLISDLDPGLAECSFCPLACVQIVCLGMSKAPLSKPKVTKPQLRLIGVPTAGLELSKLWDFSVGMH